MSLSAERQRRCYLYLGYLQVNRTGVYLGGLPQSTEVVHHLQTSIDNLTANGETTVIALLEGVVGPPAIPGLDSLYAKMLGVDESLLATKVEDINLNPKEFEGRERMFDYLRRQLAVQLDVPLDPYSEADMGGGGGMYQGPSREP